MNEKLNITYKVLLSLGIILIPFGVVSHFNVNFIIRNIIYQNLVLENDSKAFEFFKNPPAKIYRKYYIFDVKNAKDLEKGKSKPKLVQRGPYIYSEIIEKKNIEFKDKNTIDYNPVVSLFFEPSLSNGNESDLVTFLNIPAVSMIHSSMKDNDNDYSYLGINGLMNLYNIKLFVTKTVGELINGYNDPLMTLAKNFVPKVKESKFSLINGKNGTSWQRFSINTGYDDITQIGQIKSWNNLTKLDFWNDEYANVINGSDGTIYPPFLTRNQTVYAFSPDMCRSYKLKYLKDNIVNGVKTLDFHLPKNIFYNSTFDSDNQGFQTKYFLGNGILDIGKCYGDAPSYISQPHFLNADDKFINNVVGMQPDEKLHDFILHFEPNTGVAISGNVRLQINFYLKNYKKIDLVKNVKPNLIPIMWFDEDIQIDKDVAKQLSQIDLFVKGGKILPFILFIIGIVFIMFSLLIVVYILFKTNGASKNSPKAESKKNTDLNGCQDLLIKS